MSFAPNPWFLWEGRAMDVFWSNRQADAQSKAARWAIENLAPDSRLVIDISMWNELRDPISQQWGLDDAHYYSRVLRDPAVQKIFPDDWRSVDYVITTPQMLRDVDSESTYNLVSRSLRHTRPIAIFDEGGWPIKILAVHKAHESSIGRPRPASEE
jgi:hypothetical protein